MNSLQKGLVLTLSPFFSISKYQDSSVVVINTSSIQLRTKPASKITSNECSYCHEKGHWKNSCLQLIGYGCSQDCATLEGADIFHISLPYSLFLGNHNDVTGVIKDFLLMSSLLYLLVNASLLLEYEQKSKHICQVNFNNFVCLNVCILPTKHKFPANIIFLLC